MGEMHDQSDAQLLRDYAERGAEAAFAEIVARHTDLVYSAALRQVYSPDLARDVTQSVFTDLARKARTVSANMSPEASLVGWLYRGTRFAARDLYRNETRRTQRERQAMAQLHPTPETTPDWEQLRPALDDAMSELEDTDRDAVLLRYFKNHDLRTVGATLGISDDAAQKRVSRAVERLREFFAKRGVTVGAGGLAVVISTNAVQAAPVGLALTISTAAVLTGTTLATTATVTATKAIAMTALQKTIVTATIAVLAGAGIYEARQASQLRNQVQTLQQEQIQQLQSERDAAANRLAALADEIERGKGNSSELLKLRAEVGQLRKDAVLPTQAESAAKQWAAQVTLLKQKLEELPNRDIPELQFATEKEWANAAWDADLETEDGIREALSKVRDNAEETFLNQMRPAIERYLTANDGVLPTQLSELKPYFKTPVTDDMLQRYKLLQTGKPNSDRSERLVELNIHADDDYDSNREMSLNGQGAGRYNRVKEAVVNAAEAFAKDNNGQLPKEHSQIQSYLQRQIDPASTKKYLVQFAAESAK